MWSADECRGRDLRLLQTSSQATASASQAGTSRINSLADVAKPSGVKTPPGSWFPALDTGAQNGSTEPGGLAEGFVKSAGEFTREVPRVPSVRTLRTPFAWAI